MVRCASLLQKEEIMAQGKRERQTRLHNHLMKEKQRLWNEVRVELFEKLGEGDIRGTAEGGPLRPLLRHLPGAARGPGVSAGRDPVSTCLCTR